MSSAINLFEAAAAHPEDDWDTAEELYRLGWEYYLHNCSSITSENYKVIQAEVGFPETYEQHSRRLVQGIPDDASRMVKQIANFVSKYPEFKDPKYVEMIAKLIELIRANPEQQQQVALATLIKTNENIDAPVAEDLAGHPPLFETQIGSEQIVLPTYLVLDFEANCSSEGARDHEIIEFPAVLIDSKTHATVAEFRTFVQLLTHQVLSPFIKELTHITDEDIAGGLEWDQTLRAFELWCHSQGISAANTTIVTCGDWDLKTMLPNQLNISKTKLSPFLKELFSQWTNVKLVFSIQCQTKPLGMDGMLERAKLSLDGHHHSGIDDCRNIAKICKYLMETKKGCNVTDPTSRWSPKHLWYDMDRLSASGTDLSNLLQKK